MDIKGFLNTIYLGDRYCIEIRYDKENNFFTIQMNGISRIRSADGEWNFYTDEDIVNGCIVFSDVKNVSYEIDNFELNDEIYGIEAQEISNELYEFIVSGSCTNGLEYTEEEIRIIAKDVYLIDPKNPSIYIKE